MNEEWKIGSPNKSASYLLPLIGDTIDQFAGKIFPQTLYRNTFSGAEEKPELNRHVFVLYKYSSNTYFKRFEENLKELETFTECYDPDSYHVMFVFEVPTQYIEALANFRLGKYSEMSEAAKIKILKFHKIDINSQPLNPIYGTLYRKEFQYEYLEAKYAIKIPRNMEASSLPVFTKEIYLNSYKEKVSEDLI